jgi:hypothetical protein
MSPETLEKQSEIESLHKKLREIARQQGVKPLRLDSIPDDLWPQDESVDDFLSWIQDIRKSDNRGRNLE